ncbi:MAG: alpha/beta hydrolase [Bdellovibrio sp.]
MKQIFVLFSLILVAITSSAEVQYFRLGRGKVIAYEYILNQQNGPTLILLPGVNRALEEGDATVRQLARQGWNLLMPSFPSHPASIQGLNKDEAPYFMMSTRTRVQDYAEDIETLVDYLNIKQAIPVTLSYSSAVGAYLNPKKFPHLIETVPLGTALEATTESLRQQAALTEGWMRMNPIMAPVWIRQYRDLGYRTVWAKRVDDNLRADPEYYGPRPRVSEIKSGYVDIARAVEDFDLTKWNFGEENRTRDFVFAGREEATRMNNQVRALKSYMATGRPVRVVVVSSVGHVMPTESPAIYATLLNLLSTQTRISTAQFAVVSPYSFTSVVWQDRTALDQWIEKTLKETEENQNSSSKSASNK